MMDDPYVDHRELQDGLDGLARVNGLLGGYGPSIGGVEALLEERRSFSLLDVGTGSADTPRRLATWAEGRGLDAYIEGIDIHPATVEYARQQSVGFHNIQVKLRDVFQIPEDDRFDIVHAALVLHHFNDREAAEVLRKMYDTCTIGLVINDLHRHPIAYYGSRVLLPLISRNRLVRHDGPVSVLRAFKRRELRELVDRAGLPVPEINWTPLFRWQMIIRRDTP